MADEPIADLAKERKKRSSQFTLIPFSQIHHNTATNYIVRGLIPKEGLVVVYGPPKCGKSFWVMDMVLHVALNWPYRDRKVKHGNVVYIACEGASGITARIEAFRQNSLQDDVGEIPFYLIADKINLIEQHQILIKDVTEALGDKPPYVIVVDTLNRSLNGDENSSVDMGKYIKAADALRERFKCCVIMIHHSGYDSTHARGHTSLAAAIDAQIAVSSDKDTKIITSHLEFMKDGDADVDIFSKLRQVEIGEDDEGDPITSCVVEKSEGMPFSDDVPKKTQKDAAFESLQAAILEKGITAPDKLKLPIWQKVVHIDEWREHFYENTLIASSEQGAKRLAFHRALNNLKDSNKVGHKSDYIWIL